MRIENVDCFGRCFATKVAQCIFNLAHFGALGTLNQYLDGTVRQFEHLQNTGNAAHIVQIVDRGLIFSGCFLGNQ